MALLATAAFGTEAGAAVRVYRPDDQSQVVLQLGSSSAESELAQLRAASLAAPTDIDATLRYVDALIAAGARSGNERYYGYAEQVVQGTRDSRNPARICSRRTSARRHSPHQRP
jgi:hypothetical protein